MVNQPATQQMIKDILDGVTPAGKVANALTLNINGEQTEYDGSAAKSVTLTDGKDSLVCTGSITPNNWPNQNGGTSYNAQVSAFNRTPVIGETFTVVVTYSDCEFFCVCTVNAVTAPAVAGNITKGVPLTPLAYIGPSLSTTVTPSEGAYYANTIAISDFNRLPSVGESFIASVSYTPNGNVYLCTIQVDTLNVPPVTNVTQATYTSVQQVSGNNRVQRSYNIVFNGSMSTGKIIATCQLNYSEDVTMSVVAQFTDVLEELGFTADSDVSNNNMFPASGYFKPNSGNAMPVVGFVVRSGLYACAINTETMEIQQIEIPTVSMSIGVTKV